MAIAATLVAIAQLVGAGRVTQNLEGERGVVVGTDVRGAVIGPTLIGQSAEVGTFLPVGLDDELVLFEADQPHLAPLGQGDRLDVPGFDGGDGLEPNVT